MFSSNSSQVSDAAPDDKFNYVTMLLHGDGTNGAQNNTFLDSGPNTFTITRNGNTTQGSFSPYGSNWSNYFDGTGDKLTVAANTAFQFGTGNFTVEFWLYPTSLSSYQTPIDMGYNGSGSYVIQTGNGDGIPVFYSAGSALLTSSSAWNANAFNHVVVCRSGTTLSMFINGVRTATATNSTNFNSNSTLGIGAAAAASPDYPILGYVSNVRFVKGSAVYDPTSSTLTIPTTPLTAITNTSLLTCQSNRFIDTNASPKTITVNGNTSVQRFNPFGTSTAYSTSVIGGSGYFDGNGDYLNAPNDTAFQIGTGDFTYECWLYPTNLGGSQKIGFVTGSGGGFGFGLWTNTIQYGHTDIANVFSFTASGMINNQWIHFAVSRASGTMHSYVNGVRVDSRSNSTNFSSYDKASIGGYYDGSQGFTGYISDAKFTKGTGVYTGTTLTVPTAPVSAGSCTLLCSMTNGAIFDNAMMNDLETVGNAQISTSVKKYGTGSLAFDGTGDYLLPPSGQNVTFGTGNFTIEGWFYWNSLASESAIMWGNGVGWTFYIYPANKLQWGTTTPQASANLLTGSTTLATGQWYHIAVTRASNTVTLWVNGVSDGTVTDSNNYSASGRLAVGISHSNEYFNGYIDDLRITKGFARYTADFTPPTSALPDLGPY